MQEIQLGESPGDVIDACNKVQELLNEKKPGVKITHVVHKYWTGSYEGGGTLIMCCDDDTFLDYEMGHCSCYGPLEELYRYDPVPYTFHEMRKIQGINNKDGVVVDMDDVWKYIETMLGKGMKEPIDLMAIKPSELDVEEGDDS